MRRVLMPFSASVISLAMALPAAGQQNALLAPTPKVITMAQLKDVGRLDGQIVQLNGVFVRHTDAAQVFTFGDKQGPEMHVVIPNPAIDGANVGDTVTVIGTVRKYGVKDFERDYRWFRQADYPHLDGGTWVIVARSVRTPEGTDLVPGGTVSDLPKNWD